MTLAIARECGATPVSFSKNGAKIAILFDNEAALAAYEARIRADQRERDAALCELSSQTILLMAGELTSSELRAVKAVLANRAAAIRSEGTKP